MIVLSLVAVLAGAPEPSVLLVQDGTQPAPVARPVPRQRQPVRPRRRTAVQPIAPLPPPTPVPAPSTADLAPVPNRSLEAPRTPTAVARPELRPDLIRPRELPDTAMRGGGLYTDRQDRLYREPAAGARLNIPFSY